MYSVLKRFFFAVCFALISSAAFSATYWLPDYQDNGSLSKNKISDNKPKNKTCENFKGLHTTEPHGTICANTAHPGFGLRCVRNCRCKSEFTYTSQTQNLKCSDSCTGDDGITRHNCIKCCNEGYISAESSALNSVRSSCVSSGGIFATQTPLNSGCGICYRCLDDKCPTGSSKQADCEKSGGVPVRQSSTTEAGTPCYSCSYCESGQSLCAPIKCAETASSLTSFNGGKFSCCRTACLFCDVGLSQCSGTELCVNKGANGCCSDSDCAGKANYLTRCDLSTHSCARPLCISGYSTTKPTCANGQNQCQQSTNPDCWGCCGVACGSGYNTATSSCADGQILTPQSDNDKCKGCLGTACATGYSTRTSSCSDGQSLVSQDNNSNCKTCSGTACQSGYSTRTSSCSDGQSLVSQGNNSSCKACSGAACESGYSTGTSSCATGVALVSQGNNGSCKKCSGCINGYKGCNGGCIANAQCCGGCSSDQVCDNGSCRAKTCAEKGMKACGNTCIATSECCGCSGTQKCVNGSCVNKTCEEMGQKTCGSACISSTACCTNGKEGCASGYSCKNGSCTHVHKSACPNGYQTTGCSSGQTASHTSAYCSICGATLSSSCFKCEEDICGNYNVGWVRCEGTATFTCYALQKSEFYMNCHNINGDDWSGCENSFAPDGTIQYTKSYDVCCPYQCSQYNMDFLSNISY